MATIIDGKALAASATKEIGKRVVRRKEKYNMVPGLAVILVGEDPASRVYVSMKQKRAAEIGFKSVVEEMDAVTTTTDGVLEMIEQYNNDDTIHGILIQLPLPKHIDTRKVLYAVRPEKDVDGFHPFNVGLLHIGEDTLYPCTPFGVMKMLDTCDIDILGKHAVVVGQSDIVGKPMSALLLRANATVTSCHVYTKNLSDICRQADILVSAVGKVKLITEEFVKPGAVVIDVGMNRDMDGKLCGDVDFEPVSKIASHIAPVPGGVGPMTIAMLLQNTLKAFNRIVGT